MIYSCRAVSAVHGPFWLDKVTAYFVQFNLALVKCV